MATAEKLSAIINGVNVNNLFTTIDAIKAARPLRNSNSAFRTSGRAVVRITPP